MLLNIYQITLVSFVSFITSIIVTRFSIRYALKLGALDYPNLERKSQATPVPFFGGGAIAVVIIFISFSSLFFGGFSSKYYLQLFSILAPAMFFFFLGLIDDFHSLKPITRLIVQTFIAFLISIIYVSSGTRSFILNNIFDFLLTIFWIVGIVNAINFFDNIDGGAAGVIIISSFTIFVTAYTQNQTLLAALALVTCGAVMGFLYWNRFPAKTYLGDSGALFLGALVAGLLIRLDFESSSRLISPFIPIIIMAIPILDTCVAVTSRIIDRKSIFIGGMDHLSHRISGAGVGKKHTTLILNLLCGIYAILALALVYFDEVFWLPLMILIFWFVKFVFFLFFIPKAINSK